MAEMDTSSSGGHKKGPGVKKAKKMSTRIDLTPMVDLGFLLITFFMYTTTLAKPKTMEINMPYDKHIDEPQKVKSSTALTVLLSKSHRVYYYKGIGDDSSKSPDIEVTNFNQVTGIRSNIIAQKKSVDSLKQLGLLGPKDFTTVLIKPDSTSTYSDMVNMLDEMNINDITVYAIVDITPLEQEWIKKTEDANGIK